MPWQHTSRLEPCQEKGMSRAVLGSPMATVVPLKGIPMVRLLGSDRCGTERIDAKGKEPANLAD